MIKKLEHVGIRVSDMDRSIQFYSDVLGFCLRDRVKLGEKVELAFLKTAESNCEIELVAGEQEGIALEGRVHHLAFTVEGIESIIERLKENGVTLLDSGTREVLGGIKIAFFRGPDGELLELFQPKAI